MADEKKRCPFCGEEILKVAIKCKHCSTDLTGKKEVSVKKSEAIGTIALCLPIGAVFLAFFWVGSIPLIFDPGSKLYGLTAITILITAILIAVEANFVGAGAEGDIDKNEKKRDGPVAWFFGALLFWIIFFPMWMYRRSKYDLKSLGLSSILIVLIFISGISVMFTAIERQKMKIRREFENSQQQLLEVQKNYQKQIEAAQKQLNNSGY
jgi:threonine/homoserine/homoserine lactone efflux protein